MFCEIAQQIPTGWAGTLHPDPATMLVDYVQGDLFEDTACQRWNTRVSSWRHTSEGGFNARRYAVTELDYRPAQRFVTTHHYSGRFSSAVLRYGLVDRHTGQLGGRWCSATG